MIRIIPELIETDCLLQSVEKLAVPMEINTPTPTLASLTLLYVTSLAAVEESTWMKLYSTTPLVL